MGKDFRDLYEADRAEKLAWERSFAEDNEKVLSASAAASDREREARHLGIVLSSDGSFSLRPGVDMTLAIPKLVEWGLMAKDEGDRFLLGFMSMGRSSAGPSGGGPSEDTEEPSSEGGPSGEEAEVPSEAVPSDEVEDDGPESSDGDGGETGPEAEDEPAIEDDLDEVDGVSGDVAEVPSDEGADDVPSDGVDDVPIDEVEEVSSEEESEPSPVEPDETSLWDEADGEVSGGGDADGASDEAVDGEAEPQPEREDARDGADERVEPPVAASSDEGAADGEGEAVGEEAPVAAPSAIPLGLKASRPKGGAKTGDRRLSVVGKSRAEEAGAPSVRVNDFPKALVDHMRESLVSMLPAGEAYEAMRSKIRSLKVSHVIVLWSYVRADAELSDWMVKGGYVPDSLLEMAEAMGGEHRADGVKDALEAELRLVSKRLRSMERDMSFLKVASALSAADAFGVLDVPLSGVTTFDQVNMPLVAQVTQETFLRLHHIEGPILRGVSQRLGGAASAHNAKKMDDTAI